MVPSSSALSDGEPSRSSRMSEARGFGLDERGPARIEGGVVAEPVERMAAPLA